MLLLARCHGSCWDSSTTRLVLGLMTNPVVVMTAVAWNCCDNLTYLYKPSLGKFENKSSLGV